jgi:hypothetical protein
VTYSSRDTPLEPYGNDMKLSVHYRIIHDSGSEPVPLFFAIYNGAGLLRSTLSGGFEAITAIMKLIFLIYIPKYFSNTRCD